MKKSLLIGLGLVLVFLVSLLLFNPSIIRKITGNPIFSDSEFEVSTDSFKPGNPTKDVVSLSPQDCKILSILPMNISAIFGDEVLVEVVGVGCNDNVVELKIFERDYIFYDEVYTFSSEFLKNSASFKILIDENLKYLFSLFEGDNLELYFEADLI